MDNANSSSDNDALWKVEQVAQYLQLTPETVRKMARTGELPAMKIGRRNWRFKKSLIDAYVLKKKVVDQP